MPRRRCIDAGLVPDLKRAWRAGCVCVAAAAGSRRLDPRAAPPAGRPCPAGRRRRAASQAPGRGSGAGGGLGGWGGGHVVAGRAAAALGAPVGAHEPRGAADRRSGARGPGRAPGRRRETRHVPVRDTSRTFALRDASL